MPKSICAQLDTNDERCKRNQGHLFVLQLLGGGSESSTRLGCQIEQLIDGTLNIDTGNKAIVGLNAYHELEPQRRFAPNKLYRE